MAAADLILTNAKVYTVDAARSVAEAVAVSGGRIVAVGAAGEVEKWRGAATQVLDLGGRLVLPGFIDAHMHTSTTTQQLFDLKLDDHLPTAGACLAALARFAADDPDRATIRGAGWSAGIPHHDLLAGAIDAIVSDRPVFLYDTGWHLARVNSAALRLAGIDADTPDPDNGIIVRLPGGEPSGLLIEGPAFALERRLSPSPAHVLAGLRHFQNEVAAPLGLTTAHDSAVVPGSPEVDAYEQFYAQRTAGFRSCLSWWILEDQPLDDQLAAAAAGRDRLTGPLLRAGAAKFFVDGVAEGYSAFFSEPYSDRPETCGRPVWRPERLCAAATAAAQAGLQLHFHAIGDAAVSLALDAIEAARGAAGPVAVARPLITHLQFTRPGHFERMAAAGVVAVMQPSWVEGGAWIDELYAPKLGTARARRQYPMKSFWDHGVVVASSTDYPIFPPPDPLMGIRGAVLRCDPASASSTLLWPEEAVTVEQMIESYTVNGAYANFLESETGSIEAGKAADLVVLSRDILTCPPAEITDAEVELTLFAGRAIYAAEAFAGLGEA